MVRWVTLCPLRGGFARGAELLSCGLESGAEVHCRAVQLRGLSTSHSRPRSPTFPARLLASRGRRRGRDAPRLGGPGAPRSAEAPELPSGRARPKPGGPAARGGAAEHRRPQHGSGGYSNTCVRNLEKWCRRIYLQGNSGETDRENRLMDSGRGEERARCMERVTRKLILPFGK